MGREGVADWQNDNYSKPKDYILLFPTSAAVLEPWVWKAVSQTTDLQGKETDLFPKATTVSLNTI